MLGDIQSHPGSHSKPSWAAMNKLGLRVLVPVNTASWHLTLACQWGIWGFRDAAQHLVASLRPSTIYLSLTGSVWWKVGCEGRWKDYSKLHLNKGAPGFKPGTYESAVKYSTPKLYLLSDLTDTLNLCDNTQLCKSKFPFLDRLLRSHSKTPSLSTADF